MNKYRDYDNYLKEYPSEDGYFGDYGGNYLDNPDLIATIRLPSLHSLSLSCAVSAGISRGGPHRSTTARIFLICSDGHKST